jgi:hypothetical protein
VSPSTYKRVAGDRLTERPRTSGIGHGRFTTLVRREAPRLRSCCGDGDADCSIAGAVMLQWG